MNTIDLTFGFSLGIYTVVIITLGIAIGAALTWRKQSGRPPFQMPSSRKPTESSSVAKTTGPRIPNEKRFSA